MIRINLLPHREIKKAAHRQRFQSMLGGAVLIALGLAYLSYHRLEEARLQQQHRNQQLEHAIAQIDSQLKNIENLRRQRVAMLSRKQLVEQLQYSRTEAIRIFDDLIKTLPEGVYIKDFRQSGNSISITGTSLSSARVSAFMRNITQSQVFSDPVLIEVQSTTVDNIRANSFSLNIALRPSTTASPLPTRKPL